MPNDKDTEIKKALEAATPGPWTCDQFINGYGVKSGNYHNQIALVAEQSGINRDREKAKNNAHLIANAPEWLRWQQAEIERLSKTEDAMCRELKQSEEFTLNLKGENYRLNRELQQSREENERMREGRDYWESMYNTAINMKDESDRVLEQLKAERDDYRKVLDWYGDIENNKDKHVVNDYRRFISAVQVDKGSTARDILSRYTERGDSQ